MVAGFKEGETIDVWVFEENADWVDIRLPPLRVIGARARSYSFSNVQ